MAVGPSVVPAAMSQANVSGEATPNEDMARRLRVLLVERGEMETEADELVQEVESQRAQIMQLRARVTELEEQSHPTTPVTPATPQHSVESQHILNMFRSLSDALQDLPQHDSFDTAKAQFLGELSEAAATISHSAKSQSPIGTEYFEVPDFVEAAAPERVQHCRSINDLMHLLRDVLIENSELHNEVSVQGSLVSAQARKLLRKTAEVRDLQAPATLSSGYRVGRSASPATATSSCVSPVHPSDAGTPKHTTPIRRGPTKSRSPLPIRRREQKGATPGGVLSMPRPKLLRRRGSMQ